MIFCCVSLEKHFFLRIASCYAVIKENSVTLHPLNDRIIAVNEAVGRLPGMEELIRGYGRHATVALHSLVGSAFALVAAEVIRRRGGVHLFVMDDRDEAAYLSNDLYQLLDPERVFFFPTGYKRSILFGQEDASGIIQRTAALNAIRNFRQDASDKGLAICTYPEALAEKVVEMEHLRRSVLTIRTGDKLSQAFVEEMLHTYRFERVDFVSDPGQYSLRGSILDIFSYAENHPYRLDFFGDEVDSIRRFEIASQLSIEKLGQIDIVPNLKRDDLAGNRVSLARFAGEATWWMADPDHALKRIRDIRGKILKELDEPSKIDAFVTGRTAFLEDTRDNPIFLLHDNLSERVAEKSIDFHTAPQPVFNKKFELLAEDIRTRAEAGYRTLILTDNRAQIDRLRHIFNSLGEKEVPFDSLPLTLHRGFISHDLRLCFYTDHQIFERYQRYRLRGELDRSESLTVAELHELQVGDYVVHIDHGVGRFGGLTRTTENGKVQEAVKLVYRDGDVLLVNVHALHRISKYKDRESEPPKIYKLGSGAWQRMKEATKRAVKEIARDLIALYARRKATPGFAFSPDTYMQHELEASFIYEDTPDQQKATEAVKCDMESPQPMDRLVCGDVGFGKTEVAIRAAFKAVSDSKQVAVLVPTTILALQHYRTFVERLRDFPVRIEHLSRSKSDKEVRQTLEELKSGKIDILIGTHKILGKQVDFKALGLLIIDEEQKFGVAAKEKLRQMSVSVDTLTLTATPIPRTLQFSLMGSRDLSVINTPPPNRQPIQTESHLFNETIIKEAVEYEVARGGQLFFVHNRVEDIRRMEALVRRLVPGVRTAVGHGQMESKQLEKTVMDFIYGEFDVLIATTIIENGIDIPNANTIIINNAHYFGLSDLHQMRGRVGRSNRKAFCYLLSPPEELLTGEARRRLRALEEFSDLGAGFNIAMQDLDIRGAGNLLGAEQSGFIADIGFETYQKILNEAMEELRAEGVAGGQKDTVPEGDAFIRYISDSHIEIDAEAMIPDHYVSQSAEKIKLYRELDNISEEADLQRFEAQLADRFGPVPTEVRELFNVIRLRWMAVRIGFERVKVKNGLMIVQFISDAQSPYYKSPLFMAVLKHVTENPQKFVLRQNNNRLSMTIRQVADTEAGWRMLEKMLELG